RSFLPDVDAIVVDEAHDLEDAASETLGTRVGRRGIDHVLGRLWTRRGAGLLRHHPRIALRELVDETRMAAEAFFERLSVAAGGAEAAATVPLEGPLSTDGGLADALDRLAVALVESKDGV